jgi:AcrR family transcriptional regulator
MSAAVARAGKQDRERDAIMRAAFRLIGRAPGSSVSVQEILEAADLSTRAFYRHFRSKDELILTMYRTAAERFAAELSEVVAAAGDPPAALEAWVHHQLAVAYDPRRSRQSSVLGSAEARAAVGFEQAHQASDSVRRKIVADVLRRGREDGSFPMVENLEEDARAVVDVVGGIVAARLAGQPVPTWSEATEHTTALFRRAFGAA